MRSAILALMNESGLMSLLKTTVQAAAADPATTRSELQELVVELHGLVETYHGGLIDLDAELAAARAELDQSRAEPQTTVLVESGTSLVS